MNRDEKRFTQLAIEALRKERKMYAFEANLYKSGGVEYLDSDLLYIGRAAKKYTELTKAVVYYENKLKNG